MAKNTCHIKLFHKFASGDEGYYHSYFIIFQNYIDATILANQQFTNI